MPAETIIKILFSQSEWEQIEKIEHDDPSKLSNIYETSQLLLMLKEEPVIVKYYIAQYMLKNNLFCDFNHVMPCNDNSHNPMKATTLYELSLIATSQSSLEKFPIKIGVGKMGKSLIATKNIDIGTYIFLESPLFFAPKTTNPTPINMFCAYCAKYFAMQDFFSREDIEIFAAMRPNVKWSDCIRHSIPCDNCNEEFYCTNECKSNSWESFHSFVCAKNPNHKDRPDLESAKIKFKELFQLASEDTVQPGWPSNTNPLILIKVICQGIKEISHDDGYCKTLITNNSKSEGKDSQNNQTTCGEDKEMSILGLYIIRKILGSFTSSTTELQLTAFIKSMHQTKHIFDILTNPDNVEAFKLSDRAFALICLIIMKNEQAFAPYLFVDDMNSLYKQVYIQCPEYAFSYVMRIQKVAERIFMKDPEFSGIFVIQSCINHSCDRNAMILNSATKTIAKKCGIMNSENDSIGLHCISKENISEGQEITTSYVGFIDDEMPLKMRRLMIWDSHKFKCMCTLCKEDEGLKCKNCEYELNNDTQAALDGNNNDTIIKKLLLCGKCRTVWYCNKDCQVKHWKMHKPVCGKNTSKKAETTSRGQDSVAKFLDLMSK